jgi:hypothetical protein
MIKHKKNKKKVKHATRHYNTDNNNIDNSVKSSERIYDNNIDMPQHAHQTTKPSHKKVTDTKQTIPEVLESSRDDPMKQAANNAKVLSHVQQAESLNPDSLRSTSSSVGNTTLNAQHLSHFAEEKISSIVNDSGQAEKAPQSQFSQSQEQKNIEQQEEKGENKYALENENLSKSVMMPWLNYITPCTEAYNEIIKNSMTMSEYWLKLFSPWTKKLD